MAGGTHKQRERRERKSKPAESARSQTSSSPTSSGEQRSPPTAYDGNRDPALVGESSAQRVAPLIEDQPRNPYPRLDLGSAASFVIGNTQIPVNIPARPASGNRTGKEVTIRLNTFNAASIPTTAIYQYDVLVGNGAEKRAVIDKVWSSDIVQKKLEGTWIFDGNKIAWSTVKLKEELRERVNLDEQQKRQSRGRKDEFDIIVRRASNREIRFDILDQYLSGKTGFGNECLESINFLDHLMRQRPSEHYFQHKRNFFARGGNRVNLGGGVEAVKGVYASIRPVATGWGPAKPPVMSVNVDVANGTFFAPMPVLAFAQQLINARDMNDAIHRVSRRDKDGRVSNEFTLLKRLRKVRVYCTHRNGTRDEYTIDKVIPENAETTKIKYRPSPDAAEVEITTTDYFKRKYNIRLQYPHAPMLQMTKGSSTRIPMELCHICDDQRYPFKLSDKQTTEMIRFAVTLPRERWEAVQNGVNMLDWDNDKYLKAFGLRINNQPASTSARLLPPPRVGFKNGTADPKYSGRWDLRGKQFFLPNSAPLKSWGVCVVRGGGQRGGLSKDQVDNFIQNLMTTYKGHGGVVNNSPFMMQSGNDGATVCQELYNGTGNQFQLRPQLLVFIVPDKNSETYNRIKKSADCRFGVVSQVLQSAHVLKNQGQYCSNVCLKINAKLGGATAKSIGIKDKTSWFKKKTMIIGADVSHGAPGAGMPSIAALTVSKDLDCLRYIAGVETNGSRVEMITAANYEKLLRPLVQKWADVHNQGHLPEHIIYMRDGVSDGQYAHVLQQEVQAMKDMLHSMNPKTAGQTKFTVLVCSKRHHIRFFPQGRDGDRNGNPQPGTLVEVGCTHPRELDFYLCAHSAIKGTARPVHYHVLLDEEGMDTSTLANFLYEASYQYVRSTTPVSLFPAIYYAHLAAARATSHINKPSVSDKEKKAKTMTGSQETPEIVNDLIEMKKDGGITSTMWYV